MADKQLRWVSSESLKGKSDYNNLQFHTIEQVCISSDGNGFLSRSRLMFAALFQSVG